MTAPLDRVTCRECGCFLNPWEGNVCEDCCPLDDLYPPEVSTLVVLDPDRCPVDGSLLASDGMDEPALFIHGGYGATRRTVLRFCRVCGWSILREVSEVSPRSER